MAAVGWSLCSPAQSVLVIIYLLFDSEVVQVYLPPDGNMSAITSPMILPMAAPILKVGMTTPEGTARVSARMEQRKLKRAKQERERKTVWV